MEAFLLGRAEESTAQQMEELLFQPENENDHFFKQVERVKHSLLEREAGGRLAPELSADLALQCARSPALRQELEARATRNAPQTRVARPPVVRDSSNGWWWNLGLATAALMAVIVGGMLLTRQTATIFRGHSTPVVTSIPSGKVDGLAPAVGPVAATATILFMPADVLRGPSAPAVLHAPELDRPVELQIEVHTRAPDETTWSATILQNSRPVFQDSQAVGLQAGSVHYVSLAVPPGILSAGSYQVTLTPHQRDVASSLRPLSRSFTLAP